MKKSLSLALSFSLVSASVGPAFAENVVRAQTGELKTLPVVKIDVPLNTKFDAGVGNLSAIPNINSIDAQAIDAAALISPEIQATAPQVQVLQTPGNAVVPDLNAAIQAAAEDARDDSRPTAQLDRVEAAAMAGDKSSQDKAWSGLRDSVAGVPTLKSGAVSRFTPLARAGAFAAATLTAGQALAATGVKAAPAVAKAAPASGILNSLHHFASQYAPLGISLASIYAVQKLVAWIVGKAVAKSRPGDEDAQKTAKLMASLATWGVGSLAALHFGGAPAWVTEGAASLLPAGATIASTQLMGNALEASKVLLYHSFVIGDRIKIGEQTYRVADLSLTDVVLQNEMYPDKSPTPFTYIQLAGKVITVLRPYEAKKSAVETASHYKSKAMRVIAAVPERTKEVGNLVWQTLSHTQKKTWLWLAAGVGVAVGASYLVPLVAAGGFLASAAAIAKGIGIFTASLNARRMILDFLQRLGEKRKWHPQTIRVVKFFAEVGSYIIGGTWALGAAGTSPTAFMKGGFTTGVAFLFVARDVLANLLTFFRLKLQRQMGVKTFRIGNWIQTNGLVGKLVDMNMQYVVLQHDDGTHSLISYAILDASQATPLVTPRDVEIAKKKFPDPTATPAVKNVPVKVGDAFDAGGWKGVIQDLGPDYMVLLGDGYKTVVPFSALKERGIVPVLPEAVPDSKK